MVGRSLQTSSDTTIKRLQRHSGQNAAFVLNAAEEAGLWCHLTPEKCRLVRFTWEPPSAGSTGVTLPPTFIQGQLESGG
jgi:hypothetical protein